jgi:hypothetical protein
MSRVREGSFRWPDGGRKWWLVIVDFFQLAGRPASDAGLTPADGWGPVDAEGGGSACTRLEVDDGVKGSVEEELLCIDMTRCTYNINYNYSNISGSDNFANTHDRKLTILRTKI